MSDILVILLHSRTHNWKLAIRGRLLEISKAAEFFVHPFLKWLESQVPQADTISKNFTFSLFPDISRENVQRLFVDKMLIHHMLIFPWNLFDAILIFFFFVEIFFISHQSLKPNFQRYCSKSESFLQGYNDDIPQEKVVEVEISKKCVHAIQNWSSSRSHKIAASPLLKS